MLALSGRLAEVANLHPAVESILTVDSLSKTFTGRRRGQKGGQPSQTLAVDNVSFRISEGKTLALVGETGCGKSTTAKMLLMLERPSLGTFYFRGRDAREFDSGDIRRYRAAVQAVFQDPWSSLNPRMRVADIVAEPLRGIQHLDRPKRYNRVEQLLDEVGLPSSAMRKYPHEFSGGQRQRIAIARALAPDPQLIVLDEPVSSLDVSIQAQIMNLLTEVQSRQAMAFLFIAHGLATVRHIADDVAVMYSGRIVELGEADQVFGQPKHPYTKRLLAASFADQVEMVAPAHVAVRGQPHPSLGVTPADGCLFSRYCPDAMTQCVVDKPELMSQGDGSHVACHLHSPEGDTIKDPHDNGLG